MHRCNVSDIHVSVAFLPVYTTELGVERNPTEKSYKRYRNRMNR